MLHRVELQQEIGTEDEVDWSQAAQAYQNIEEMPSFLSQQRARATFTTTASPEQLQGKQLEAYTIVHEHVEAGDLSPLRIIISGRAGTGSSYLINCLRLILQDKVRVAAPTGVAAFNVDGHTLHSLPTKGD